MVGEGMVEGQVVHLCLHLVALLQVWKTPMQKEVGSEESRKCLGNEIPLQVLCIVCCGG